MSIASVCAIVLDYFGAEKTRQCLTSLINQGLTTVYILDNSANAGATAQLCKVTEELVATGLDYEIRNLSAGTNLGFGRGVNFVLTHDIHSESPHDYYLLLNNDAVAGPGLVSGLLSALGNEPQAVLAAPRIVSSQPGREYGIWYHRYLGLLLSRSGYFRFHYFTGCCLLIPRNSVGKAGLFDEAFFMYGEDVELGWRLRREGKKMVCAKNVYVEHEYGPSVDRSSFFYEYHMARGHLLLSFKTYVHPMEIPFLILTKLTAMALRSSVRTLRHRTFAPLKALCCAWFRLKNVKLSNSVKLNESRQTK
jgi:N-acetylglucosaminyl-diphospho-decaprenol L-rhamnosyltransferase